MNVYAYVGGNPINGVDKEGLEAYVKCSDGTKKIAYSNKQLRYILSAAPNKSIDSIEIVGHGNRYGINVSPGKYGDAIIYMEDGTIIYDDDLSCFSDSVRDKLSDNGVIYLNGCNTSRETVPFLDNDHITKALSNSLKDVTIKGRRGFGFSNEVSVGGHILYRGDRFGAVGWYRAYRNGQDI